MSLYDVAIPTFKRTLTSLGACLKKAEAHAEANGIEPSVLINARLYPDMYPLKRQVQIAADSARRGAAGLAGVEPPVWEDNEESFDELQARITRTVDFLDGLSAEQFSGAEAKTVELPLPNGSLQLDGTSFLMGFAMSNFYFHVVTAYDILRHNGVPLGKMDFLGAP